MLRKIKLEAEKLSNPENAEKLSKFFKTGKGEYGEGDVFLGITVPQQRAIAKKYHGLGLKDLQKLLSSKTHEHRMIALLILAGKYEKSGNKKEIFDFYIDNTKQVNNWDLVDFSAPKIAGKHLLDKDKTILKKLAASDNLWERRTAMVATYEFIRNNDFDDALEIAGLLLNDEHDLIHKAVGWMLREIGKRDHDVEEAFLEKHCRKMPRTMLRYAIEKFDEEKRRYCMAR